MKTQILRAVCALGFVLLLSLTLAAPAFAASITEDLFYLSERSNMAIRVDYDTVAPQVSFISPSGAAYDDNAVANGIMTKEDSGTSLFFMIPNAAAGQWKVVYDKGSNNELNFNWGPYGEAATIQSLTFTVDGDRLTANFFVDYVDNSSYSYTLSAAVVDETGVAGSKELTSGSATANQNVTRSMDIDVLNTYDSYRLMLHITMNSNGIEVFDTMLSDATFAYTNPQTPDPLEGFDVQIGVSETYLRVDWTDERQYYAEGYLLSVYEDNATEPSYYIETESDVTVHEVVMAHKASQYRIELRYKNRYGIYSEPVIKTVDMTMKDLLTIPDLDVTNFMQLTATYDFTRFTSAVKATVTVNDTNEEILLSGSNTLSINLDEYQNKIAITWWADETISFKVSDTIYSDRKAPLLYLYEISSSTIRTDKDTYILTGSTTAGCTVTVGGQVAAVGADGIFTVTLPLNAGANQFAVIATSPAGNTSQQLISIERTALLIATTETGILAVLIQWLPLILAVVFACLLCGHLLLSRRIIQKRKGTMFGAVKTVISNSFLLLAIASLVGVIWTLIGFIPANNTVNSVEFYYAAQASVSEAYELLQTANAWMIGLIVTSVVFVVTIALAIVFRKLPADMFSKGEPKPKKEKNAKKAKNAKENVTPAPVQETTARICPVCGTSNPPDCMFCGNCGQDLSV